MAKEGISYTVHIDGVRETLAKLKEMPKEASDALREASMRIAGPLADSARRAFTAGGYQGPLVASTVRVKRDRVPVITAGGSTRVGRNKKPVYKVLFGTEFGANFLKQFHHPHLGREGYYFFPTVEREDGRISVEWNKAADEVMRDFGGDV